MVILKLKKEELHRFILLTKSQATSFVAHDWTTKPSDFFCTRPAYLLEYTMAANHCLFEKDGSFWLYLPGECV